MWQKFLLVVLYMSLMFLIFRSCEWYYFGLAKVQNFVHPFSLSAKKLHSILEDRGVLYATIFEKKELVNLVEASGGTVQDDVADAEAFLAAEGEKSSDLQLVDEQSFTGSAHFYEQVEDCKDSAWLVQVVSVRGYSILPSTIWNKLAAKLQPYGIRFGLFDCRRDPM